MGTRMGVEGEGMDTRMGVEGGVSIRMGGGGGGKSIWGRMGRSWGTMFRTRSSLRPRGTTSTPSLRRESR